MKADGILGRILRGEGGVHVPVKLDWRAERESDTLRVHGRGTLPATVESVTVEVSVDPERGDD